MYEFFDVYFVEDFGGVDVFRFDVENGKIFFCLGELVSCFGMVSEGDVGNDSKNVGDDVFNGENYVLRG